MPKLVAATAMCTCTMGSAPGVLSALPMVPTASNLGILTTTDVALGMNITPFGSCQVSVPPIPCALVPAGTWTPPATKVKVKGKPALLDNAKLQCGLGGMISITNPGQQIVQGK